MAPLARPRIMFVAHDIDGDGPIIGTGADFEDKDPGTQMDLAVTVISTAVDQASVRVTYGSQGKPEPGIRPWNGGPGGRAPISRSATIGATAEPARWFNVPWLGHDNTIVAKVRNVGDLIATGVVVDFFVTEYTTGDGPWVSLGSDDAGRRARGDGRVQQALEPERHRRPALLRHRPHPARIRHPATPPSSTRTSTTTRLARTTRASSAHPPRRPRASARACCWPTPSAGARTSSPRSSRHTRSTGSSWSTSGFASTDARLDPYASSTKPCGGQPNGSTWESGARAARVTSGRFPIGSASTAGPSAPTGPTAGHGSSPAASASRSHAGRMTDIKIDEHRVTYTTGVVRFADDGQPVTSGVVLIEVSDGARSFTVPTEVRADGTLRARLRQPVRRSHEVGAGALPGLVLQRPLRERPGRARALARRRRRRCHDTHGPRPDDGLASRTCPTSATTRRDGRRPGGARRVAAAPQGGAGPCPSRSTCGPGARPSRTRASSARAPPTPGSASTSTSSAGPTASTSTPRGSSSTR